MKDCLELNGCQAIGMPAEGEVTKFKSFRETVKIPFVINADFESLLHKLTVTQKLEVNQEQTEKLQKHVACSYGYRVVCCYNDSLSKPYKMYRGIDSVHKFFTDIFEEEKEILEKLKNFQKTPSNYLMRRKYIIQRLQNVMFVIVVSLIRIVRFVTIVTY